MKVIFLDFDGVINIPTAKFEDKHLMITCSHGRDDKLNDPIGIGLLNALCLATKAEIVVSSSWRTAGIGRMRELLYNSGLDKSVKIQGCTPYGLSHSTARGKEVQAYLRDRPQIEDYIILDDDSDFDEEQKKRLVLCDHYYGFKLHEFIKASDLLGNKL